MKSRTKIFLATVSVFLGVVLFLWYSNVHNYYEHGESDRFELKIGGTFTIKISANGSTGYQNCWINERRCRFVKKIDEDYQSSWQEKTGMIGAGGSTVWTFQATAAGVDTVKIESCPPINITRGCEYFCGDSLHIDTGDSIVSTYAPYRQGDYTFVVVVTK